ncbi:MAG: vWA domain-containing protein [Bacteroidia bacterium]
MIDKFFEIEFANPWAFWLLLLLPAYWTYYWFTIKNRYPQITFSSLQPIRHVKRSISEYIVHLPIAIRSFAIALIIIALARPQTSLSKQEVSTEGIDIVLAIDISSSMLAQDFEPNRLKAASNVAMEFINGRPNDRIGLVVFAGESFTQCPITTDHKVVLEALEKLESGLVEDGTAIGMGLATAADRLKDSKSKSKVVILLTDGENNKGIIDPKTAAEIAASLKMRVYTIGVGTEGVAPYPVKNRFGQTTLQNVKVNIDEELLEYIANLTGVSYYRATNENKLNDIFEEIDRLEKSRIQVASFKRYSEEFYPLAIAALVLLVIEQLVNLLVIKRIP